MLIDSQVGKKLFDFRRIQRRCIGVDLYLYRRGIGKGIHRQSAIAPVPRRHHDDPSTEQGGAADEGEHPGVVVVDPGDDEEEEGDDGDEQFGADGEDAARYHGSQHRDAPR